MLVAFKSLEGHIGTEVLYLEKEGHYKMVRACPEGTGIQNTKFKAKAVDWKEI